MSKAILNKEDIKLLKKVFATKSDLTSMENRFDKKLKSMEKRQDAKYATKVDLTSMEKRQQLSFEKLEAIISRTFSEIESKFDIRLTRVENEVGLNTNLGI